MVKFNSRCKFAEFIKHSKRLIQTQTNGVHVRVIRKGKYRQFWLIDEDNLEAHFIEEKKREDAYNPKGIQKLYNRLERERQNGH